MKSARPLNVVFFKTESGNDPVRDWLRDLPRKERHSIGEDLLTVQHAWPVGKPLVDNLGDGMWELRSRLPNRIARMLFMFSRGEIVVFHGFIKKTQKTPTQELELARRRKRIYEQNYEQK